MKRKLQFISILVALFAMLAIATSANTQVVSPDTDVGVVSMTANDATASVSVTIENAVPGAAVDIGLVSRFTRSSATINMKASLTQAITAPDVGIVAGRSNYVVKDDDAAAPADVGLVNYSFNNTNSTILVNITAKHGATMARDVGLANSFNNSKANSMNAVAPDIDIGSIKSSIAS